MSAPARPPAVPAEEALAAVALIRAYTARDLYTGGPHPGPLGHQGGRRSSFAAIVASSAAVILDPRGRTATGTAPSARRTRPWRFTRESGPTQLAA